MLDPNVFTLDEFRMAMDKDPDNFGRVLVAIIEERGAALIGAVPCPGDHGAVLPCPSCGAAL